MEDFMSSSSVELRHGWRKSTHSGQESDCVEVAVTADGAVLLRNSKRPELAPSRFTPSEWTAFLAGAKGGEFDNLV
jgi:hypothetical protein